MKKLQTGFAVERLRQQLLQANKIPELLQTYSKKFPEIVGTNSPSFWDKKFSSEAAYLFPMAYDRNMLVAASLRKNSQVLNLGAGAGYLEEFVWHKFGNSINWVGTDFTHQTLTDLARKYPSYSFKKTGLLKLPFADNTFDYVCLLEVLEHIAPSETFRIVHELYRVLKPGGTAIVSVPLNEGLESMMPYNPNAHLRVYSVELVCFELTVVGLQVRQIQLLSAFGSFYYLKKYINDLFHIRQPNNVIIWAKK